MDFAKSDIQTMLLDSAERLLADTAGVEYWREQRHSPLGFDEARWTRFAELGWLALPLPEAAGGLEGTLEDVALLNIALGKALATEPYVSSVVLATQILKHASDQGRVGEMMGEIAAGTLHIALAHQEPDADPLAIGTVAATARRTADGFTLSGAKLMVSDAASAMQLILSARIESEDGIALFLVPTEAEGMTAEHYPLIDGTRSADFRLADVRLPAEALLVGSNSGEAVLGEAIHRASVALMAQSVGAMEACIRICGDYARERKQFGVPIGSFQAIQHILADMFVATHQARSMLYHTIAHSNKPAGERAAALSAARIVVGEAGQLVSRNGIQVHGGYGLTDEYAVSHYFRRLMSLEKQFGDLVRHTERFGDSIFA